MPDSSSQQLLGVGFPTVHALRAALLDRADGPETLRAAGYAGGADTYAALLQWVREEEGRDPSYAPTEEFVNIATGFFERIGWGRYSIGSLHEAAAIVDVEDGWEVRAADGKSHSCHLTTGLLVGFFEQVAEYPVAAIEVECTASGAGRCRFLVGNIDVLDHLFEGMQRGESYEALAAKTVEL